MKKFLALFFVVGLIFAQGIDFDLMGGLGVIKGSNILDDNLFLIKLSTGANYGLKAQAFVSKFGVEAYYILNSLEPDAINKVTHGDLDFSDKFATYGLGFVLRSGGILSPYFALDYGKTKFLGTHTYSPDGKHYSLALGIKFVPSMIGIWAEAKLLRVSDILKDFHEFNTSGKFTTFSVTAGGVFKF